MGEEEETAPLGSPNSFQSLQISITTSSGLSCFTVGSKRSLTPSKVLKKVSSLSQFHVKKSTTEQKGTITESSEFAENRQERKNRKGKEK